MTITEKAKCIKCGRDALDHCWPSNQGIWQMQHRFEAFPTIPGRPANINENEDEYIERTSHENYVSEGRTYGRGME